jgi:hypothetical protein
MKPVLLAFLFLLAGVYSLAQHEHHAEPQKPAVHQHEMDSVSAPMTNAYSLNLPMNRNGSGTGWLMDKSPMYGYMMHSKKWMWMVHGNIFVRHTSQDIGDRGTRGDSKTDVPNWLMAMGQRRIGERGLFHFNTMFSLDPLFGGAGYPLLFQTGESHLGQPLVDRQHPHDLFSEISVSYSHSFSRDVDAFIYFGLPGEPALGPVAFMHRPSALNNPDATLGHHWTDATHITFGVATLGLRYKIFKFDASLFTGREPDERRYNFDRPRFDSYAGRLTVNPFPTLSAQFSMASINSPEGLQPDEDVRRTTASVMHTLPLGGENKYVHSTAVWGYNNSGGDHTEHSVTFEPTLQLDKLAVYGRFEWIQKSAGELRITGIDEHHQFDINAFTLGASYTFLRQVNTNFAIGAQGSVYSIERALAEVYGERPISAEIYLRISPGLLRMK